VPLSLFVLNDGNKSHYAKFAPSALPARARTRPNLLTSIRNSAEQLRSSFDGIDFLINNAGISQKNAYTVNGMELHFGTNHIGHFALTGLLLDLLLASPGSRIVTVSSATHRLSAPIDFEDQKWEHANMPIRRHDICGHPGECKKNLQSGIICE
jgi:NAD(P)-dependent dehydrogenase (short-subunit alcohol dehydrogenase family)